VSGQVKYIARQHFYGALPLDFSSLVQGLSTVAHALFAPIVVTLSMYTGEKFTQPRWSVGLGLVLGIALVVVIVELFRQHTDRTETLQTGAPTAVSLLVFPVTYLLAHTLVFDLVWRAYANWYALPTWAVFCILLAIFVARAREVGVLRTTAVTAIVLSIAIASWFAIFATRDHGPRGPQRRFQPLLDQAAAALPDGGVLGAFDAGALGYVAGTYDQLYVTNLDGLVNNAAYEALRTGRYRQYVEETVDIMVQDPARARMFLDEEDLQRLRRHFGVR
jgi:hypothetical protein